MLGSLIATMRESAKSKFGMSFSYIELNSCIISISINIASVSIVFDDVNNVSCAVMLDTVDISFFYC